MRLPGQFQASLLCFLRKDFGRKKSTKTRNIQLTLLEVFVGAITMLPLLFSVCLFLSC